MNFKFALLGLLSRGPISGYDLKKQIANSAVLYWSGNNNQIYRTLVQLHDEGLVTYQVEMGAELPVKKIYSISPQGLADLKSWLRSSPETPELRNDFLIRLAWADLLDEQDFMALLDEYEEEIRILALMEKEKNRRSTAVEANPSKAAYLLSMIGENMVAFYENELAWLQKLRQGLERQGF
jgi:PadR family transcriptional regulator AphA